MTRYNTRGRPPGSSRLNVGDSLHLRRIAEQIVLDPTLRVTPAMRAIGVTDEVAQRRLRRKWKNTGHIHLTEAKAREADLRYQRFMGGLRQFGAFLLQVGRAIDHAATAATERYIRWADENPREAENLKRAMLNLQTLQIAAKPQRS